MNVVNNPYAAWSLPEVMRLHSQRLLEFLRLKGPFAGQADAVAFHAILQQEASQERTATQQIRRLRQIYWSAFVPAPAYPRAAVGPAPAGQKVTVTLTDRGLAMLVPHVPVPPASFLDIGCGSGFIASGLARHWSLRPEQVVGLDIRRPQAVPDNIRIVKMRSGSLPRAILGRNFDLVLASMVFHHATCPEKLIVQIAGLLDPDGHLVIREHDASESMIPMLDTVHILLEQVFARRGLRVPSARRYMGLSTWKRLTEAAGLEQVGLVYSEYPADPANTCCNFTLVVRKT